MRDEEAGFSFIELLVVTIIIGILAAIALIVFTGEQGKAHDSSAKSDVAAVVVEMESCHVEEADFRQCDDAGDMPNIGIELDDTVRDGTNTSCSDPGFVTTPAVGTTGVLASGDNCFVVAAASKSEDGGAQHIFMQLRNNEGERSRTCGPPSIRGKGGCPTDGTW